MKNAKITSIIVIALLLSAVSVSAVDVEVLYLDGYLDVKDSGDWYEVYIGDVLKENDTIKLDKDSYAELMADDVKITLTQAGTYTISDLLQASGAMDSAGIGTMISGKFKTMFEETAKGPSTVGGVRAAEVESASDSISWMGSEAEEMIKAGKKLLGEGDLEEAFNTFQDGYDFAMDEEEEYSLLFFMGYSKAMMGEIKESLEYLSQVEPNTEADYYHELFILRGQMLVQTFGYEQAIEWLQEYEPTDDSVSGAQTVYILMGLAYKAMGQNGDATSILRKAVNLAPGSEEGAAAKKLMSQI
jgi:tetratricopeptide (TPR) repeat protein